MECLQPDRTGGEGGIRTLGTGVSPYNGLANRRIRPLCHLSGAQNDSLPRLTLVLLPLQSHAFTASFALLCIQSTVVVCWAVFGPSGEQLGSKLGLSTAERNSESLRMAAIASSVAGLM
jgi:hypothetical protein